MAKIVNREERMSSPIDDLIQLPDQAPADTKSTRDAALGNKKTK
ncbi:hypothetical protein [Convivina intestini]|uniref:Uncharacterized protein n=1 Tax=Convivina intestini TaxID=1505726 RepID=A0A2U1DC53_9LACO|nr:hypothetical protein [Convivina intestini]PVY85247.1 hypothetical protein C7384_10265 [Convivina intestini]CAH1850056.1 hypothetical protein R078131_00013 [Convivina intestini]CAH1852587.1 hypothetical protein R077811_00465 [Convivina intestini]SDB87233.1 hypothetical protein SAMN05216341_102194 [Leuconostocaceae bacterium R-53105]